jgi:hypothetical protein
MDRYTETEIRRYLVQSRDLYLDGFERAPDDTYCGINAASKTAMLGDLPQARRLARLVHERLAATEPRDYYERATVAEASVLLGEYARAAAEYRRAAYLDIEERGSIGSTWLQLQRLRAHLPMSPEAWASLAAVFRELGFEEEPSG